MALVFWALLTIVWSVNTYESQANFMTLGGVILTTIVIGVTAFTEFEEGVIRDAVVIGGMAAAMFALHLGVIQWLQTGDLTARLGLDWVSDQFAANPNGLALSLLLPIALSASGILTEGRPARQAWFWCAFVMMTVAVVLTQSRGGLLALGALLVTLALRLKLKVTRVRAVLAAAFVVVVLWEAAPVLTSRFEGADFWSGAGRWEIWEVGVRALSDHWVMGAGVGTFPYAYRTVVLTHGGGRSGWVAMDAHNVYLGLGVELGLIGLILFVMAMRSAYRSLAKADSRDGISAPFVSAALIGLLVGACFSNLIRAKWFWLTIALSMVAERSAGRRDRGHGDRQLAESRVAVSRVRV